MLAIAVVVLVADVMDLFQRAVLGQLVKSTRIEQRVHVLPMLEALPHNLKVRFEIGVVDVQVTACSPSLFPLVLDWHFSYSLELWHFVRLCIEVLN